MKNKVLKKIAAAGAALMMAVSLSLAATASSVERGE